MNKKELEQFICETLDIPKTNSMIDGQISKFINKHGYSYKDIGRAIYFYVEVLGREPKKEMGIGIVPFVMDEARKYFYRLEQEEKQRKIQGQVLKKSLEQEKKVINVKPVRKKTGIPIIKIEDI